MPARQNVTLVDLPVELLVQIYSHLHTARSVRNISLTCKALNQFTKDEGWRAFTQARFPSFKIPDRLADYREAAHGLTTLSRNWDRKSFLARYIEPETSIFNGIESKTSERWRRSTGQTIGYLPFIDSYEELTGRDWGSRRQVLAWSAGAELLMRVQLTGQKAEDLHKRSDSAARKSDFDEQRQWRNWFSWRLPDSAEGRDDITTVNLIKPPYFRDQPPGTERIIVGTASGSLSLVHAPVELRAPFTKTDFDTGHLRIRSTDVSPAPSALIASCLSTSDIALYPLNHIVHPSTSVEALDRFTVSTDKPQCQIRSTKFISGTRLAVSLGPTAEPIKVFEITPDGIKRTPIRTMAPTSSDWNLYERPDGNTLAGGFSTSVYPILPLSEDSSMSSSIGNVFFSGCYFGAIRLHDLRSPRLFEMALWDTNDSAVYSIQNIGRERLVAAYSRYSTIRVFDARVPDGRCYSYNSLDGFDAKQSGTRFDSGRVRNGFYRNPDSYNLFLVPQRSNTGRTSQWTNNSRWQSQRTSSSPVYSLSSPSSTSSTIFAGVENKVMQIDLNSSSDPYPDPVYHNTIQNRSQDTQSSTIDLKNPWKHVLNLAMYGPPKIPDDRKKGFSLAHRLLKQADIGSMGSSIEGIDERWIDSKDF